MTVLRRVVLIAGLQAGSASAAPAMGNYEFLPVPARVSLGGSVTLTMAGCVDPAAAAAAPPSCPPPTVLAESVSAEAGTLRQLSPTQFAYTAPVAMPAHSLVRIRATYQQPFQHAVDGLVILEGPKPKVGATGEVTPPGKAPGKPPRGNGERKFITYAGFVSFVAEPPPTPGVLPGWQRNYFWLEGDDDTSPISGSRPGEVDGLLVKFGHMVGSMARSWTDEQGQEHYLEGTEVFDGDMEVFSYLQINTRQQLYGWQVHGQRLGDRPPSSPDYADSGYNTSCREVTFDTDKTTTQSYVDLFLLAGALDCGRIRSDSAGIRMTWYFVPLFR